MRYAYCHILTLGHFQVMALTLLLQYSRNSNNYGLIHFQHYVEKYIEPFISDLPQNNSFYRQLDYLRCTQEEREPITLAQVLSNSISIRVQLSWLLQGGTLPCYRWSWRGSALCST